MISSNIDLVQTEPLWERVAVAMRRAIVLGDLPPGSHLKEPFLAQRFGVSRLPIREAIASLEREGLVRVEPRRGARVMGITAQDIHDIYECRLMLEAYAIRRAATRIDATGIAGLRAIVDQMAAAVAEGQVQVMAAADMAFHRMVVVLSGNRALLSAWKPLAPLIETILTISDAAYGDLPRSVDGHRSIVEALEQHDGAMAEGYLPVHLAGAERLVLEVMGAMRDSAAGF